MPSSATTRTHNAPAVKLRGEAREVVLGEAQAVLAMVADDERRGRLAALVAAVDEGEIAGDDAQALSALEGTTLERVALQAVGPAAFVLSLAAGGTELSVRLDRQGARLTSVGV